MAWGCLSFVKEWQVSNCVHSFGQPFASQIFWHSARCQDCCCCPASILKQLRRGSAVHSWLFSCTPSWPQTVQDGYFLVISLLTSSLLQIQSAYFSLWYFESSGIVSFLFLYLFFFFIFDFSSRWASLFLTPLDHHGEETDRQTDRPCLLNAQPTAKVISGETHNDLWRQRPGRKEGAESTRESLYSVSSSAGHGLSISWVSHRVVFQTGAYFCILKDLPRNRHQVRSIAFFEKINFFFFFITGLVLSSFSLCLGVHGQGLQRNWFYNPSRNAWSASPCL